MKNSNNNNPVTKNVQLKDVNGKSTYSTSDKMPDLFPEYNKLKKAT